MFKILVLLWGVLSLFGEIRFAAAAGVTISSS
jgi:hypothetical protein